MVCSAEAAEAAEEAADALLCDAVRASTVCEPLLLVGTGLASGMTWTVLRTVVVLE